MNTTFYDILAAHASAYPDMKGQDYSCLAYESEFGSTDVGCAEEYEALKSELNSVNTDALEPMTVKIGGGFCRLSLPAVKRYLSADIIYKMMELTASEGDRSGYERKIRLIEKASSLGILPKNAGEAYAYDKPIHSSLYKQLYGASYRVVSDELAAIAQGLCLISEALEAAGRVRIGIDGTAASGKTRCAELISKLFDGFDVAVTEGFGTLSDGNVYDVRLFLYTDDETRRERLMEKGGEAALNEYEAVLKQRDKEYLDSTAVFDCDLFIRT